MIIPALLKSNSCLDGEASRVTRQIFVVPKEPKIRKNEVHIEQRWSAQIEPRKNEAHFCWSTAQFCLSLLFIRYAHKFAKPTTLPPHCLTKQLYQTTGNDHSFPQLHYREGSAARGELRTLLISGFSDSGQRTEKESWCSRHGQDSRVEVELGDIWRVQSQSQKNGNTDLWDWSDTLEFSDKPLSPHSPTRFS